MHRWLLVLLLVSCGAPAAPVVSPIASAAPPPAPAVAPAPTIARVAALHQECSGAGGLHVVFEVLDAAGSPVAIGHAGGHGYWPDQRFCVGDRFTVDYVAAPRTDEDHDRNPDSGLAGWCLEGLPRLDGEVTPLRWLGGPIQPQPGDAVGLQPRCAGVR